MTDTRHEERYELRHHSRHEKADPATLWERGIYWGLVGLLFWAPLPFGGIRGWSVAVMVIWVAVLGALWAAGWLAGKCTVGSSFYRGRFALGVLALWALLITLQAMPLPAGLVNLLSPGAAAVHAEQGLYSHPDAGGVMRSVTLSIDAAATQRLQLLTLALTGYFALLLLVIKRTSRLRQFTLMLVTSGILYSAAALYLHFTGATYMLFHEEVMHEMAKGPFLNRNHFGTFIEICLACGVGLIVADFAPTQLTTRSQRVRWALGLLLSAKARMRLLLIVMVIALILTRSRMGNVAFFTALIAGGFVALLFLHAGWKSILVFLASMLILDAAIIGSWIGVDQVIKRVQQTALTDEAKQVGAMTDESVETRTNQALSALPSVRRFPLFGTGAGSFMAMYPQYKPVDYPFTLSHAHNDFIHFLVETGVLGAALLFTLMAHAYLAVLRTLRSSKHQVRRGLALGAFIGMLSAMIHATVEFAFQISAVALAFTALVAIAVLAQDRFREAPAALPSPTAPPTP